MVRCGPGELGNRAVRVRAAGAGEPHRLPHARSRAAQDPSGGHHADGVRAVRDPLHETAVQE